MEYYGTPILMFIICVSYFTFRKVVRFRGAPDTEVSDAMKAATQMIIFMTFFLLAYTLYRVDCISTLIKILSAVLIGILAAGFSARLRKMLNRSICLMENHKLFLLIFLYFFIRFMAKGAFEINDWVSTMYATNYTMGFGPRFLIGTLLTINGRYYLTARTAYLFCAAVMLGIIIIQSILLSYMIRHADEEIRLPIAFLCFLYIASPGSISAMWTNENFGRFENYLYLTTLIAIIGFVKCRSVFVKYAVLAATGVLSLLIYQGYLFTFFSVSLFMMMTDLVDFDTGFIKRGRLVPIVISCVLIGMVFLLLQFGGHISFRTAEEMKAALEQKTDLPVSLRCLQYEYFGTSGFNQSVHNDEMKFFLSRESAWEKQFLTVFLFFPLIWVHIVLWRLVRRNAPNPNARWWFKASLLLYLCHLPIFYLMVDWGRWSHPLVFFAFFRIFYLTYMGSESMKRGLIGLRSMMEKEPYVFVALLLIPTFISSFRGRLFIEDVDHIYEMIKVLTGIGG